MENEVVYTGLLRNAKEFYTKDDVINVLYCIAKTENS